ncbi:MAG: WD40 repeat domain-containing protein [Myxococcales bacterium]|nr:WD40 repeat domain-containing protein [Myxococcales bacterium]
MTKRGDGHARQRVVARRFRWTRVLFSGILLRVGEGEREERGLAAVFALVLLACGDPPTVGAGSATTLVDVVATGSVAASASTVLSASASSVVHDPSVPLPPKQNVASYEESRKLIAWRLDSKGFAAANGSRVALHTVAGGQTTVVPGTDRGVIALALSPKGGRIATLDAAGRARVWDTATGALVAELPGDVGDYPLPIAFAHDCSAVAAAGQSKLVVWDLKSKTERCHWDEAQVSQLVFTDDIAWVIGTGGGNWMKWNARSCKLENRGWARTGGTFGSWLDLRGRWLGAAEVDGHGLSLYEGRSMKPIERLASSHSCKDHTSGGFSTDGEIFFGYGSGYWFKSIRASSLKTIAAYDIPGEPAGVVPFDDGERIYLIRDGKLTLVNAVEKKDVVSFDVGDEGAFSVSPDGTKLAGMGDSTVTVRDALTGKVLASVAL